MTLYAENETDVTFPFPVEETATKVIEAVLKSEGCPFDATVNLLITDNEGIREYNRQYREIDKETDVLSFPNLDFDAPGDFSKVTENKADYFDPDSGELILGDVIVSANKVIEQAENYGHDQKREFAFLVAHSMLHLCGYDHMADDERVVMEEKQEAVLQGLGITR
ncbi:MAG: rRNA maturation RNase YbeY [Lachnospiraceae bacterium]|nr:rRNA maturation RNase YbeY [Lachnospiraceae bacterium]